MRKLLEQHTIGKSRVWLESDFQLMRNDRLLKRYWVYWEDEHTVKRTEWVGRDDIALAHRAYVETIQARQGERAAGRERYRIAASIRLRNRSRDYMAGLFREAPTIRAGAHYGPRSTTKENP